MPFTMTHLIIAKNVAATAAGLIDCLPRFYLGSIAPDAVHNRVGYEPEMKKTSHLISGREKWGYTTDNEGWEKNIIDFMQKNAGSEKYDFILGYCTHALADVYNNKYLWTPFRLKYGVDYEGYAGEERRGYGAIYSQECNALDRELALTYEGRDEFWRHLGNAECAGVDLPGIIYGPEIERQKDYILNHWYADKKHPDLSSNTLRTYEGEMAFIRDASDYVAGVICESLGVGCSR